MADPAPTPLPDPGASPRGKARPGQERGGRPDNVIALRPRRRPRPAQWPVSLVFGVLLTGIGVLIAGSSRSGNLLIAASVVLAFALRLVLRDRAAGLLVVRTRVIDLAVLGALGVALVTLALSTGVT